MDPFLASMKFRVSYKFDQSDGQTNQNRNIITKSDFGSIEGQKVQNLVLQVTPGSEI